MMSRDSTDHWCCDDMLKEIKYEDFTLKEIVQITGWKYCHYCGRRLSHYV